MKKKKVSYDIKINRGKGFLYEGCIDLNVFDTSKKKELVLEKIRKEYDIQPGEYLNISNFFDVYH